jgi:uncharacterized membrane protein required for colicin V production
MNILDACIIFAVGLIVIVGFFAGFGRVAVALVSIYAATIISATSYEGFGRRIRGVIEGLDQPTAELLGFLIVLIAMAAIFYYAIGAASRQVEQRRGRLAIFDNIGGLALAIVGGLLTIALTLSVTVILLGAFNRSTVAGAQNLGPFGRQIESSELVPLFLKLQPAITYTMRPWFPGGLPPILDEPPALTA